MILWRYRSFHDANFVCFPWLRKQMLKQQQYFNFTMAIFTSHPQVIVSMKMSLAARVNQPSPMKPLQQNNSQLLGLPILNSQVECLQNFWNLFFREGLRWKLTTLVFLSFKRATMVNTIAVLFNIRVRSLVEVSQIVNLRRRHVGRLNWYARHFRWRAARWQQGLTVQE